MFKNDFAFWGWLIKGSALKYMILILIGTWNNCLYPDVAIYMKHNPGNGKE